MLDRKVFISGDDAPKVALLKYTHEIRRLFYVIEQPVSSQMFRTPECQQLKEMLSLVTVSTWLGLFGHILMKSTKLLSNLPNHDRSLAPCSDVESFA